MLVSFFEEFPTKENLDKIKLINWPAKLYLATEDLDQFKEISKKIKNKNIKEIIYWPLLQKDEGYWISPFSKRKALNRIFSELWGKKIPLMLDLELPKQKKLYFSQLHRFRKNKQIIKNFINSYKGPIHLAEYYPDGKFKKLMLQWTGLHYDNDKVKIIKMIYHSMHRFTDKFVAREFRNGVEDYGEKFIAGLGTIATGIKGNEPILSVTQLEKDLNLARKANVHESIIFRLGGLEHHHTEFIKERPPKVIIIKRERKKHQENKPVLKKESPKVINLKRRSTKIEVLDLTKKTLRKKIKNTPKKSISLSDKNLKNKLNNNDNNTIPNAEIIVNDLIHPEATFEVIDEDNPLILQNKTSLKIKEVSE